MENIFENTKPVATYGIGFLDEYLQTINKGELVLIGASAGCVDSETEFFSQNGWKKISEYQQGDLVLQTDQQTQKSELVEPLAYIKERCNRWYHFTTKYGLDMKLSAEHQIIYKTCRGNYTKESAENVAKRHLENKCGFRAGIPTSFDYGGIGIDLTDAEIKLMLAVIADGSFRYKNFCVFHVKKDRKKQELLRILQEGNFEYHWYDRKSGGYSDIRVKTPRIEKEFTSYWYNCNKHQLELICDNVLKWDGSIDGKGRKKFSTTIKASADFVQFAFSACGYKAVLSFRDRRGRVRMVNGKEYVTKSIDYSVIITNRSDITLNSHNKDNLKIIDTDDVKYCFTVPSHCLVLRRNGKIFVTGNCGKSTMAQKIAVTNSQKGIKTALFSLENSQGDTMRKEVFNCYRQLTKDWKLTFRAFNVMINRHNEDPAIYKSAYAEAEKKLSGVYLLEKPDGGFDVEKLKTRFYRCVKEDGCQMIIVDHLDYFDQLEDDQKDECKFMRELMKVIRELMLQNNVPVIAFSQFRKPTDQKMLIPTIYEFYGSSDKAKIATTVITVARNYKDTVEETDKTKIHTYIAIRKDRFGANKMADCIFDLKTNAYLENYRTGNTDEWGHNIAYD